MQDKLLSYFNGDDLASSVWLGKYAQEGEETPDELWKLCEDNAHAISNYGRVMNIGTLHKKYKRGRSGRVKPFILKNRLSSNSYYITYNNNFIHRLVAEAFLNNLNNYKEVNHIDGNKLNNHVNNLEWCTRSENIKHSYDKKLRIKSSEESSKLTTKDINEIRKLYSSGDYLQKDLGIKFGIKQQQISKIINYKQWK